MLPRKAARGVHMLTVPQTNTGRQGEYPKARERTLVKGTLQIGTVTSGEGVPSYRDPSCVA